MTAHDSSQTPQCLPFAKGHGTGNDFVIIPDGYAATALTPELIAGLCDRRRGIGGDGLLRVARAGELLAAGVLKELPHDVDPECWFMDYWNADGSTAEMCGNGVRVFAHWLRSRGLVDTDNFTVGTRAGARPVQVIACDKQRATVSVAMGEPQIMGVSACTLGAKKIAGVGVDMGNPHLACVLPGLSVEELNALPVADTVQVDPEFFPDGANIEVVTELQDGRVYMRVHERGAGETLSCGTGTVAAAVAALADAGEITGIVRVIVPGGEVEVEVHEGGSVLCGPSVIVAEGTVDLSVLLDASAGH